MDIRKVKKLIDLLEKSGISELEITEGEESVRISRHPKTGNIQYTVAGPPPEAAHTPAAATPAAARTPATAVVASEEEIPGHKVISPMVGTYYASPAPDSDPFVKMGDEVKPGDTLCIIEAMKMMNQIEADKAGRIAAVLAANGEPVEYGQTLFIIQ